MPHTAAVGYCQPNSLYLALEESWICAITVGAKYYYFLSGKYHLPTLLPSEIECTVPGTCRGSSNNSYLPVRYSYFTVT